MLCKARESAGSKPTQGYRQVIPEIIATEYNTVYSIHDDSNNHTQGTTLKSRLPQFATALKHSKNCPREVELEIIES